MEICISTENHIPVSAIFKVPDIHSLPYIHIGQGNPSFRASYFHGEVGLEPWLVKTRERLPGICWLKLGRRQISVTELNSIFALIH